MSSTNNMSLVAWAWSGSDMSGRSSSPSLPDPRGVPRFPLPLDPALNGDVLNASNVHSLDAGIIGRNGQGGPALYQIPSPPEKTASFTIEDDDEEDDADATTDNGGDLIVMPCVNSSEAATPSSASFDRTLDPILPDLIDSDYGKITDVAYTHALASNASFAILPQGVRLVRVHPTSHDYRSVRHNANGALQGSPQRVKILKRLIKPEADSVRQARVKKTQRLRQEAAAASRAAEAAAEQAETESQRRQFEDLAATLGIDVDKTRAHSTPPPMNRKRPKKSKAQARNVSTRRRSDTPTGDDDASEEERNGSSNRFTHQEKLMVYELVFHDMDAFESSDSESSGPDGETLPDKIARTKYHHMKKHHKRLCPWLFFKQMQNVWWRKARPRLIAGGSRRTLDSYINLVQRDKDLYSKCLNAFDVSGGSRPDEESTDYDDRPSRTDRLSDEPGLLKFYKSEWFAFWEESPVKDTDHLIRDFALTELGGPVPKTAESRKRAKPKTRVADIDTGDDDDALVDKQDEAADEANLEDERRRKARKADARAKVDPACPGSLEPKTLPDAIPSSFTSQNTSSTADQADGLNTFLKTLTEIETGRFENEKEAAKHARVEAKAKVKGNLFSMIKLWEERHMRYQASGDWDRAEKAKERLARLNDQLFDKEDESAEE